VDQPAHLANQAATEVMVETVNLVNQEIVVIQLHLNHRSSTDSPNNAHAKLHQANKDQPDQKDPTDLQVMLDNPVVMVNQETKDHVDQTAKLAKPVKQVKKVPQEMLAKPHQNKAQPVLQEAQAKLVVQALQVKPEVLEKTVNQVVQEVQEMQAQQEELASLVHQVEMAMQANKETQEAAPTAHQLVWLQDIKHHSHQFSSLCRELELKIFNASIIVLFFHLFKNQLSVR